METPLSSKILKGWTCFHKKLKSISIFRSLNKAFCILHLFQPWPYPNVWPKTNHWTIHHTLKFFKNRESFHATWSSVKALINKKWDEFQFSGEFTQRDPFQRKINSFYCKVIKHFLSISDSWVIFPVVRFSPSLILIDTLLRGESLLCCG